MYSQSTSLCSEHECSSGFGIIRMLRALVPILMFCLMLPFLTSCESKKTIVNKLTEKEANEIIVFLSTKGIDSSKAPSGDAGGGGGGQKEVLWDISVPEAQALEAMSLLNQAGLPRRRGQNLLNIFKESGLVPSEMTEKIRYQAGLAEQIASTIRKIDGVLDAEVQISFPEEDPLNPGKTKGDITASVYVKHSGALDDPNSHLTSKIKRLVTSSVTGLKFDNVTVISDRARFSDFPVTLGAQEEEKAYVKTWTLILAKESLFRFRLVFATFTILLFLSWIVLIWVLWKVLPLLKESGGIKAFLSLAPLAVTSKEVKGEQEGGDETAEEGEGSEEEEEEEEEAPPKDVT